MPRRLCKLASALIVTLACSACVTGARLDGPPAPSPEARPGGFPEDVRLDAMDPRYEAASASAAARAAAAAAAGDGSIDIIALSGGGAGGAFGAGILVGLTEAHARPQYEIVTGVSTGALIAPFAFLGPDWDDELTRAYAGGSTSGLMRPLGLGALFGVGFYEGGPLRDMVESYVTDDLLAAVAAEYAKGRLLLVATTNLDREETMIWNMGAIAQRGGTDARALFRDVLVASASVPGVFPPVMISVHDAGQSFQEMHVDGGASLPFFIAPDATVLMGDAPAELRGANVYVVSNSQLAAPSRTTPVNTVSILSRSFTAVMNHMTRAAIAQAGAFSERNHMSFHFSTIPRDYPFNGSLAFDEPSMSALFQFGRRCAAQGRIWVTAEDAMRRAEEAGNRQAESPDSTACPLIEPVS